MTSYRNITLAAVAALAAAGVLAILIVSSVGADGGKAAAQVESNQPAVEAGVPEPLVAHANDEKAVISDVKTAQVDGSTLISAVLDRGAEATTSRYDVCFSAKFAKAGGSSTCRATGDDKQLSTAQANVTFIGDGRYVVSGAVPDGTTDAVIKSDASETKLSLAKGMFIEELDKSSIGTLAYRDSSGKTQTIELIDAVKGSGPNGP